MNKRVLITGGAGFIGSSLTQVLLKKGYKVTILDNLSPQIHGQSHEDSPLFLSVRDKVDFILGDVRNREDWEKALKSVNIIVHLAAETGTGQSMYEVQQYVDVNTKGTAIMLDMLVNLSHQIEKVIVASSRAIYGEGKYQCATHGVVYPKHRKEVDLIKGDFEPKCSLCHETVEPLPTDEDSKIHPSSVYGITKQNQEQLVLNVCESIGVPAVAYRYQNVYGPGQSLKNPYTGILSIFSNQIRNNNDINIFEDGKESRDFVFIDDVISATILGIEKDAANFQVFNVGSGVATTVSEVAAKLYELYDVDININISGNFRIGDIRHNYADVSKIQHLLGWQSNVDFITGITRFSDWVKGQGVQKDQYSKSIREMKEKGLFK